MISIGEISSFFLSLTTNQQAASIQEGKTAMAISEQAPRPTPHEGVLNALLPKVARSKGKRPQPEALKRAQAKKKAA